VLAFSWPHGSISLVNGEDTIEVRGIGVMNPDGSAPRLLTQTERPTDAEDESPVWSPDGSQIAFVRLNITAEPRGMTAIFVMNADGTDSQQITPWDLRAADIDWSPDGSLISFRSEETGQDFIGDLYTVHPDGSNLSPLTDNDGATQVLASSFSPDSEWLAFAMTGVGGLPDLFVMRTDGSDLRQLTETPLWESAPDWSPVEES
jgi:TolB protein